MKQLVKISKNAQGQNIVDARELHGYLEVGKDFSTWIKNRLNKYQFVENEDFEVFTNIGENPLGGRPSKEYALTLDTAKELAMVENNKKGRKVRKYFIEFEKTVRQAMQKPTTIDQLKVLIDTTIALRDEAEQIKALSMSNQQAIKVLEQKTTTRPNYFTVAGFAMERGFTINIKAAAEAGRKAAVICKERSLPMDSTPDPRFGKVRMYPKEVLAEVFDRGLKQLQ